MKNLIKASFLQRIVLPAVLAVLLFVFAVFGFMIPAYENIAIAQKRQMLNELTNTAWSVLNNYHFEAEKGIITQAEARVKALAEVEALRYGADKKDYFWIIDEEPTMIMHPYVHELMGESLHDYTDPDGKQPFIEATLIAKQYGEGFINYKWQFKDDKSRIVPKLSFVKAFPEWGWIIGTGIYLDDVQAEISLLTNKLILILLGITLFIALIIVFIAYQSLRIENQRYEAEQQLHESREKYRSLLESSTEGILLLLNGKIRYSNSFVQNWLHYSGSELENMEVHQLFRNSEQMNFDQITTETSHEMRLVRKDGSETEAVLTVLPVRFATKEGLLITLRDVQEHQAVKSKMAFFKQRLEHVSQFSSAGFFCFPLKGQLFHDINQNVVDLLGYSSKAELMEIPVSDILYHKAELRELITEVKTKGMIRQKSVALRKRDGEALNVFLSIALVDENDGEIQYCDGMIDLVHQSGVKVDLHPLAEKLSMHLSKNRQLAKSFASAAVCCTADVSLDQAIETMRQENATAVLLRSNDTIIGIITMKDIMNRFFGKELPFQTAATSIMSAPVISANDQMTIAEAAVIMLSRNIAHLVLFNAEGQLSGLLEKEKLFGLVVGPDAGIDQAIGHARSTQELFQYRSLVPELVKPLTESRFQVQDSCSIITSINDMITKRIIEGALLELGAPPVPFCFIVLGSAGRNELVFSSDQDNAIIYADSENEHSQHQEYFLQLGSRICERLQRSGLPSCPGDYMASNPKWCQPLGVWKNYFAEWIEEPDPENILKVSVFFDLRFSYGESELFSQLTDHIFQELSGKTTFYYLLAQSVASYKPPLKVFGGIVTESTGSNEILDIKSCIAQIVMFARIYALRKNIHHTNTMERIRSLADKKVLSKSTADELLFHFNFLMQHRMMHQLQEISMGLPLSNTIVPKKLSEIEQMILKKVLSQMGAYHEKLGAEFMSAFKG